MLTLYLKIKNIVFVSELGSRIFWVHDKVQARLTNYSSWTEETQIIIFHLMNVIWGCLHTVFDSMVRWIWMTLEFIKVDYFLKVRIVRQQSIPVANDKKSSLRRKLPTDFLHWKSCKLLHLAWKGSVIQIHFDCPKKSPTNFLRLNSKIIVFLWNHASNFLKCPIFRIR